MIDITFDFQGEVGGRDSDKYSKTLQEYHRLLWSKPLPNGKTFELTKLSDCRLYHKSDLGEFYLSSDRAVPTFYSWVSMQHIITALPNNEAKLFDELSDTIGGIIIWPSKQINGLPTMNGERGFNRKIADRLDLTIECIRRYYKGETSPLYLTLKRYSSFFDLFDDFPSYIDFFLLNDAVSTDYSKVKIAEPFDNFLTKPVPKNVAEYYKYMESTTEFVNSRNIRIAKQYS